MKTGYLPKEIKSLIKTAVIWIFLILLVLNPFNSSFVMSMLVNKVCPFRQQQNERNAERPEIQDDTRGKDHGQLHVIQ